MMKRLIALAMLLTCIFPFVYAYEVEYNGLKYEIDIETMSAFLIKGNKEYGGKLTIPNIIVHNGRELPVTKIKAYAIEKCKFTTLTIPASITMIEQQKTDEYQEGISVDELIFEDSNIALTYYNSGGTFSGPIKNVYLGRDITYKNKVNSKSGYGNALFEHCPVKWDDKKTQEIENFKFGNLVKTIPEGLFIKCRINTIDFGYGVEKIGEAFMNCEIMEPVVLPESLKEVSEYTFIYTKMNTLILPNSIEVIPNKFTYDSHLKKLTLGAKVRFIGNYAFSSCDITSVIIPSTIEEIGAGAFLHCNQLKQIVINSKEPSKIVVKDYDEPFEDNTYIDGILYVPKGTVEQYQAHKFFRKFFNIQEYNETSIKSIFIDNADAYFFNMQGNRTNSLQKGVNIIRKKNGETKKVLLK